MRLLLAAVLFSTLAVPTSGQSVGGRWETLWQFEGTPGDRLGWWVAGAGDVDGDGCPDLIAGAPDADPGGRISAGSAFVYSGATGAVLWRFDGAMVSDHLGNAVAGPGDVDGDGHADLLVGSEWADPHGLDDAGSAFVYSGATGAELWRFDGAVAGETLGFSVAGPGDVDGDGHADLLVGADKASPAGLEGAGSALLYSGATGALLMRFDGPTRRDRMGYSVGAAGDVDGDGTPDLIIGADEANPNSTRFAGSAFVYSGADGALLWRFDGELIREYLGWAVDGAGDVNADGHADLIVGAVGSRPGGVSFAGSASVFCGATGERLWRAEGVDVDESLGNTVSGAGDVNGDGFDDVIVGAYGANTQGFEVNGTATVYSGASGQVLQRFDGLFTLEHYGSSVDSAGDVDGDGGPDLVVGSIFGGAGGSAFVYSFDPFLETGSAELSVTSGVPVELFLDFPASEAGRRFVVLASASGTGPTAVGSVVVPLTPDPLFQRLRSGWTPSVLEGSGALLDRAGDGGARVSSDAALGPLVGRTIHLAALSWGPRARLSSVARPLTITP